MGTQSYSCAPCCYVVNLRVQVAQESQSLHQRKFFCFLIKSAHKSGRFSCFDQFGVKKLVRRGPSKIIGKLKGFDRADSTVLSASYDTYVVDGEENERSLSDGRNSVPKLLIPGLPDESNNENVAPISRCSWEWKPKMNVYYEKSGSENVKSPAVLFLPGFGVGSFHYEKQLKDLGHDYRAWALDFLGQGMSLPIEDPTRQSNDATKLESDGENVLWGFGDEAEPWAKELVYSIDLWRDQVRYFIEEVIKEPVYLVGNSLGGYVSLYFAACNPHLVKGVTLLNATPFWGFLPNPIRSPTLSRIFPWAGTFPLPAGVRKVTEVLWQKISDPNSIAAILRQVYADHSTKVDKVFYRIVEITKHPAAAASLTSIMCAPCGQLSFEEALKGCQMNNVPICLMYGKDDPWVKPVWGLQVKRQLPEAPYYEISPAGHCPHDEVPEVVNFLLRGWIRSLESQGSVALPLLDGPECIDHDVARDLEFIREESERVVRVQIYGSKFSLWSRLTAYFKSRFEDREIEFR